jgi:hypothetical protein
MRRQFRRKAHDSEKENRTTLTTEQIRKTRKTYSEIGSASG